MAREDVNIKVSSNIAEAIQLWKAMEAGPEGMARSLESMGRRGQSSTKGLGTEALGLVGKFTSVAGAIALVTKEIRAQADAVRKLREEKVEATNTLDDLFNRFRVQAGISDEQAPAFRQRIMGTAAVRHALPATAMRTATELASQGLPAEQASGQSLDEMLQMFTAVNQGDLAAPEGPVKAMMKWLRANQLPLTPENIRKQSVAFQSLFRNTPIQLPDLEAYAANAAKIREFGGVTSEESMALATQGLEITDMEQFGTALRNATTRLQTSATNTQVQRGLSMVGLSPKDVQGRNLLGAMQTIETAMAGYDVNIRDSAANLIFGLRGLDAYMRLTATPGALAETAERARTAASREAETGFKRALVVGESGRGAAARQAESLYTESLYDLDRLDPDVVRKRAVAIATSLGMSEGKIGRVKRILEDDDTAFLGMMNVPLETRVRHAAVFMQMNSRGQFRGLEAEEIMKGEREIKIRLTGPDGRDIPHEVEAVGIQER